MKYLFQGREDSLKIIELLSLTRISSDSLKESIVNHLCKGESESVSCITSGVTQSNFNRGLSTLNEVAATVERIKEIEGCYRKIS